MFGRSHTYTPWEFELLDLKLPFTTGISILLSDALVGKPDWPLSASSSLLGWSLHSGWYSWLGFQHLFATIWLSRCSKLAWVLRLISDQVWSFGSKYLAKRYGQHFCDPKRSTPLQVLCTNRLFVSMNSLSFDFATVNLSTSHWSCDQRATVNLFRDVQVWGTRASTSKDKIMEAAEQDPDRRCTWF